MSMMTAIIPPPDPRRERLEALFAAFQRDDIETAVDMLIERLDAADGDPDIEQDGDEGDYGLPGFAARADIRPAEYRDADRALEKHGPGGIGEDDEEDDPAGGAIDDEPHDAEEDKGAEEDGEPDDWQEPDVTTAAARRPHRDRIRRTRCDPVTYRGWSGGTVRAGWRLRSPFEIALGQATDLLP